jgi:hypothetical protein
MFPSRGSDITGPSGEYLANLWLSYETGLPRDVLSHLERLCVDHPRYSMWRELVEGVSDNGYSAYAVVHPQSPFDPSNESVTATEIIPNPGFRLV